MKAVVCGGGTGGHVYPALSIASRLRADGHEVLYMGGKNSMEEQLAVQAGFAFRGVDARGLSRKSLKVFADLLVNWQGRRQARAILGEFKPQVVIGSGGYASAPVVSAAQQLRITTLLHEQNTIPGRANRMLAKKAAAVCLTFPAAKGSFPHAERLHLTGLPVRQSILSCTREQAENFFDIPAAERDLFTVLVTGGSAGAASLNKAMRAAYDKLLQADIRIIHICGKNEYFTLRQQAPEHPRLILLPYLNEMENALAAADLAVARAGASFLSEAAACGLPCVLVPYPYAANDHQRHNALAFEQAGAAVMVADGDLNGSLLAEQVITLSHENQRLAEMSAAARSLSVAAADEKIAALIYQLTTSE